MPLFDPANPDFDLPDDPGDRERWRRLAGRGELFSPPAGETSTCHCPSDLDLAQWLDGRVIEPVERALIESHLASCPLCLEAVVEVRPSVGSQGEGLLFVAPQILAAAKNLVSPGERDVQSLPYDGRLRFAGWMNRARWSGAVAACVFIGVVGWQAGRATPGQPVSQFTGQSLNGSLTTDFAVDVAAADDRDFVLSELSLGALGWESENSMGEDGGKRDGNEANDGEFSLFSLSFDEGSAS